MIFERYLIFNSSIDIRFTRVSKKFNSRKSKIPCEPPDSDTSLAINEEFLASSIIFIDSRFFSSLVRREMEGNSTVGRKIKNRVQSDTWN